MEVLSTAEEERKLNELQDLHESILLNDGYFTSKNLLGKGRVVVPTAKQRRDVQNQAALLRFSTLLSRRRAASNTGEDVSVLDAEERMLSELDLTAKPRTFVNSGPLTQYDPDKLLRKSQKRHIFLFSDLLVIALPKDSQEYYDVQQVFYVKDIRIRHSAEEGDELSFELIVVKSRQRPQQEVRFKADEAYVYRQWIEDIENTLLAYHRQTEITKNLGWFHEIIQGNMFSAAYLGDAALLRKHIKRLQDPAASVPRSPKRTTSIGGPPSTPQRGAPGPDLPAPVSSVLTMNLDSTDASGMTALHWCVLRGHEICARMLLDRGAEVDAMQKGLNTPLLLACAGGHENLARLLIDRGAELRVQNHRGYDAVFMAALCGHAAKGLPWLLQLLHAKGLDLNAYDRSGATPLHLCAERNLARPVRMLVDAGADVNARHAGTALTPLQMACSSRHPDVETIRSFLDKGAYPNWRDLQGRSAFDLALRSLPPATPLSGPPPTTPPPAGASSGVVFSSPSAPHSDLDMLLPADDGAGAQDGAGPLTPGANERWRAMEATLQVVGDWVVRTLPALLELSKKGARFDGAQLLALRPSVRAAVLEAKEVWEKKQEPENFLAFVRTREASGEDLKLHKKGWSKDDTSSMCQLCSDAFSLTNRRHHCRSCGVLVCVKCSTKRVHLTAAMQFRADDPRASFGASGGSGKERGGKGVKDEGVRVCDGCFNRLLHEASLPSLDHFRVRQLKKCAQDVMQSLVSLVEDLDMAEAAPNGPPGGTAGAPATPTNAGGFRSPPPRRPSLSPMPSAYMLSPGTPVPAAPSSDEAVIDLLKSRQARLLDVENIVAKFLEASEEYHKISKKLIEQKVENNRLWGAR